MINIGVWDNISNVLLGVRLGKNGDNMYQKRLTQDDQAALESAPLFEELFADFHEARRRIAALESDSDALETPLETLIVEPGGEQPPIDDAEHFVNAVAEDEPTVLHRDASLRAREKLAVHIDNVFLVHFVSGYSPE